MTLLRNLREKPSGIPTDAAAHLLNGMLFEVYFNKTGHFRKDGIKGRRLPDLLRLQTVRKFEPSISFMRRILQHSIPFSFPTIPHRGFQ